MSSQTLEPETGAYFRINDRLEAIAAVDAIGTKGLFLICRRRPQNKFWSFAELEERR